jgi:hypothetical protein
MKVHAVMEMVVVKWGAGVVGAGASWRGRVGRRTALGLRDARSGCHAGIRVTPGPGFVSGLAV